MSANIVEKETIDIVVTAMVCGTHKHSDYPRPPTPWAEQLEADEIDDVGRQLWTLNISAVEARYPGEAVNEVIPVDFEPAAYKHSHRIATRIEVYKQTMDLVYQCTEGPWIYTPAYKDLQKWASDLAHLIVRDLADYRSA